ncbi:MAG: hypothetical protein AAB152_18940 [Candidatus Coatesbacteria bacterium]
MVALLVAGSLRAAPPPCSGADLPPAVAYLLQAEASLTRSPVWPGCSLLKRPMLFFLEADRQAWLVGGARPPVGYRIVCQDPVIVAVRKDVVADFSTTWDKDYKLKGLECFAFRFAEGENVRSAFATCVHEYFHSFQSTTFVHEEFNQGYEVEDADNQALAAMEQRALARAVTAKTADDRARFARVFVAVRALRNRRWGEAVSKTENCEERLEGTADYVEQMLVGRPDVLGDSGDAGVATMTPRLMEMPLLESMAMKRLYATGSAQGYLLDLAGVVGWKEGVVSGKSLFELMAAGYPVAEDDRQSIIEGAKTELFGYEACVGEYRDTLAQTKLDRDRALAAYDAQPGYEIRIGATSGYTSASSTGSQYRLPDRETFYTRIALFKAEGDGYRLELKDLQMIKGTGVRFRVSSSATVLLDGKLAGWNSATRKFLTITIKGPGLSFEAKRAGTWTIEGRVARIDWEK